MAGKSVLDSHGLSGAALLPGRGKIPQLAFVPHDFDATVRFWIERMAVGPFFMLGPQRYQNAVYRGTPIALEVTLAAPLSASSSATPGAVPRRAAASSRA